jgi:hypothetical protein
MENEVNELEFDRESETNISVLEGMHCLLRYKSPSHVCANGV